MALGTAPGPWCVSWQGTLQHPCSRVALSGAQPPALSGNQVQLQPNSSLPFSELGRLAWQPWMLLQLYTMPSTEDMSIVAGGMPSKAQGLV